MTPTQMILTAIFALIAFLVIRRMIVLKGVKHYTPEEVAAKLRAGEAVVLLDVRTDAERQHGSITPSIHIPMPQVRARLAELKKHAEMEIICYCAVGTRSAPVAAMLQRHGFRAANMKGGLAAWKSSGLR